MFLGRGLSGFRLILFFSSLRTIRLVLLFSIAFAIFAFSEQILANLQQLYFMLLNRYLNFILFKSHSECGIPSLHMLHYFASHNIALDRIIFHYIASHYINNKFFTHRLKLSMVSREIQPLSSVTSLNIKRSCLRFLSPK